eukprot:Sspe_Gene.28228::Locus_12665_Transcript_1_1_Confidence_1.000_Length_2386::g.28228::m.28228
MTVRITTPPFEGRFGRVVKVNDADSFQVDLGGVSWWFSRSDVVTAGRDDDPEQAVSVSTLKELNLLKARCEELEGHCAALARDLAVALMPHDALLPPLGCPAG